MENYKISNDKMFFLYIIIVIVKVYKKLFYSRKYVSTYILTENKFNKKYIEIIC